MNIKKVLSFLFVSVTALFFSGCGDSGDNVATGPANAAAFNGASIEFNPKIDFLAGNNLNYTNTDVGSPFPAAATATAGTYTYVPNNNFTAGTLTIVVGQDTITLEISQFNHTGGNITGFTARTGGQSYPVIVTGSLPAYVAASGSGTGESNATNIPQSMLGSHTLTFDITESTTPIQGVPADGTSTTFTVGERTLSFDGRTLTNPIFYNGNQEEWIFKDGPIWWAVSQNTNGGLAEINVQAPYTSSAYVHYGQYNDGSSQGGTVNVDGDGKFTPESTFAATISSDETTSAGLAYGDIPNLNDPTQFRFTQEGSLQFDTGGGGVFVTHTLPFQSATSDAVTYRFNEFTTYDKTHTITVNKDENGQPTTLTATFVHAINTRITTRTYTLSVQN